MKKYVLGFQPGFNPTLSKGSVIVYFSDKSREVYNNLTAEDFNALLNVLEQKNIAYNKGYFFCDYPHNAVEQYAKNNVKQEWED